MIKKWKFISRKKLLDHPRMSIVEDTVELPDGKQTMYIRESQDESFSVAVIAINDLGEILLQREYSYPPDEVMYQLPGGSANVGEDIVVAGNRELREESGYVGTECKVIGSYYVNNRRSNRKQFVVVCSKLTPQKLTHDDEEFIENEWMSIENIDSLIRAGQITNIGLLAALHIYKTQI